MRERTADFLKTHEVAAALNVSVTTLYTWLREGKVPEPNRHSITGYRLWTLKDLEIVRGLVTLGDRK